MKKWLKTVLILAGILLGAAGLIFGVPALLGQLRERAIAQAAEEMLQNTVYAKVDDLTSIVSATGSVRPEQYAVIAWQTSGVVDSVLARVGDPVTAGEKLAELSATSLSQGIINAEIELVNAQKALDDLLASNAPAAAAQLELVQAQQAFDDASDDRSSKNYQRVSDLTLDQLEAEWLLAQNALEDAEKNFSYYEDRPEGDAVRLSMFSMLTNARQAEQRARANYDYALGGPDELEVGEADALLAVAQARLEDAQRAWERIKDGPAAEDIRAAQARIDSAQAALKMSYLESSFGGTITTVNVKPGDSVSPGSVAFRVDDLSHLYVDAYVLEVDINTVKVGQEVTVELDAIPGVEYQGKVVTVASVGEKTGTQVQFLVSVEILNADESVKPGMTAEVSIVTDRITNILMVPNQTLLVRDGKVFVNVVGSLGAIREVEITTGLSANSYTQVLSGDLKDGDELLLNLPTANDDIRQMMMQGPAGSSGFFGND